MGKIIFRVAAVIVLLLGAVLIIFSDNKKIITKFQNAPVVSASELKDYSAEEGSYVIVTNIHFVGNTVRDERNVLDGDYYVIKVVAEERGIGNEDEADKGWYTCNEKSYVLMDSDLKTDAFPFEKFELDMVPIAFTKTSPEEDEGFDTYRYQYYAISDDVTLTALAKIENGEPVLKHLYEYDDFEVETAPQYLIGDKEKYDKYIEYELGKGSDGSVIFVAVFVAALLWFISLFFNKKVKQ